VLATVCFPKNHSILKVLRRAHHFPLWYLTVRSLGDETHSGCQNSNKNHEWALKTFFPSLHSKHELEFYRFLLLWILNGSRTWQKRINQPTIFNHQIFQTVTQQSEFICATEFWGSNTSNSKTRKIERSSFLRSRQVFNRISIAITILGLTCRSSFGIGLCMVMSSKERKSLFLFGFWGDTFQLSPIYISFWCFRFYRPALPSIFKKQYFEDNEPVVTCVMEFLKEYAKSIWKRARSVCFAFVEIVLNSILQFLISCWKQKQTKINPKNIQSGSSVFPQFL